MTLSRQEQQGFILAQKLRTLKDASMGRAKATEYIAEQKPSDYLDTEDTKWNKQSIRQLIDKYGDVFGEGSPDEPPPSGATEPVQKKKKLAKKQAKESVPTKKKVSKKKAQAKRG